MKKFIVLAFTIFITIFSFGQKKELKEVEKAIKQNNFAEAKTILSQLESTIASAESKLQDKYYFLKGKALYANGAGTNQDIDNAIANFDKVKGSYLDDIKDLKTSILSTVITKANNAFENKNYAMSSKGFEQAYRLSTKDTIYLYYAASTAVNGQEYDSALKMYQELKDIGFTGATMEYYALNKETGMEESFTSKQLRDISVKSGTHIKPEDRKAKSKVAEIVKNIALIYMSQGDNEKAIAAMKDARSANPDDLNLLLSEANLQYKMGNTDKFKELMEEATQKDPENPELQYNLGVIAYETGDKESAKKYYQRAIDLDPNYINAEINMAALILDEEEAVINEMNSLGNSAADNKRYDELKNKRQEIYESAIPYLEKAIKAQPDNLQAAKTLMNIYSALGETQKYKELKAKIEAMESGN